MLYITYVHNLFYASVAHIIYDGWVKYASFEPRFWDDPELQPYIEESSVLKVQKLNDKASTKTCVIGDQYGLI